jgi:uracil-DNA glycosylase
MKDDALMHKLKKWARGQAKIDPRAFRCPFHERDDGCNKSIGGKLNNGEFATMSFIGRAYALADFRLVMVGIDHGEKLRNDFTQRREGIEDHVLSEKLNQHYRGIVRTAVSVFGKSGEDCRRCAESNRCTQSQHCVIHRIAQPNFVKCVPQHQKGRKSKATWTMWNNCAHHLVAELKLLRPHLIVFHGAAAREHFLAAVIGLTTICPDIQDSRGPVLYQWQAANTYLLFLHHPSHGRLAMQWKSIVVPALDHLRRGGHIPPA